MELLGHGAEGRVYAIDNYFGRRAIVKERAKKGYRVPELDAKLTKSRLIQESRCVSKARRAGLDVPCIYSVDVSTGRIIMERVEGKTIKEIIFELHDSGAAAGAAGDDDDGGGGGGNSEVALRLAELIGEGVAKIHDAELIHGDLTTSNIMARADADFGSSGVGIRLDSVVFIDFGLASSRPSTEDKAVDLYVLERAFSSTHPDSEYLVKRIIEQYRQSSRKQGLVLQKLEEVRLRGRKREMIG
jgi:TP53 regulating kinase-like protein